MYQTLVAPGVNQAFDVLNPTGSASSNFDGSGDLPELTESSTSLRYRDDYQMMTSNVLYSVTGGLAYVTGTYHPFGNNGTAGNVNNGSDTALNSDLNTNGVGITASQLYQYLTTASDHLPVVADYTIPSPPALQSIQTVFIILEENQNWASISGNAACPYINSSLLPMASYARQYYNPPGNHPSLPNYLWLEAGTNFGVTADGDPSSYSQTSTNHLVTLLKNAGISWTSYQEDISGTVCPLTAVSQYAPKHNPMVYFDDVTNTNTPGSAYCIANVRPFTELAGDLQSNVVTRYNFITPNLCNDMHGNTGCLTGNALITAGDTWLSNNIPIIMNSQAYSNNGVIFVTWDEGEGGDGPIGMIVISPLAKGGGYSNTIYYTHSSTLLTMQEIFNVGPLLGDAANATDLSDLFTFGAQLAVSPASGFTSSGVIGGPFSPSNQTYTISNTGGVPMVWSVTNSSNWLTLSPTSGTLAASAHTSMTVSINANANSLSSGSYSDTVAFLTSNGSGNTTEPVSLTISNVYGQLTVSPSSGFVSGGPPGGPFNPISQTYTLSNTGGASLNWTATNSAAWLTLSATSGSLGPAPARTSPPPLMPAPTACRPAGTRTRSDSPTPRMEPVIRRASVNFNIGNFGFYDNFATFSSGNLVGQQNWTQLGGISGLPVQITSGQAAFPGGQTANNQTPYKNFALTNETVFYGLTLTVTNAPATNAAPSFAVLYTGTNATGSADFRLTAESPNSAKTNYLLGVRVTGSQSDPYVFGATGLSYGTQYCVIVQAVAGGTNGIMYVNPTSGNLGAQTQYAKDTVVSGPSTVGSFAISQLDSGTIPGVGGMIGKVAIGDNFATVYTELLGAPAASFTASPTNGAAPLAVTFTDTSSGGTNWSWTFGDGGTTNLATNVVVYTYNTVGVYSVTEIVSGAGGSGTDTVANCITVSLPPPVASFTATPTSGAAPLSVNFTDQSSGATGWAWAFGDNNTSSSENPSDIYVNPGTYTVQEIVTGNGGSGTDTVTNMISVYDPFAWWQQAYGITNCALCAANASYTGDGMSNTNKFMAGFNPTNAAAYLHVISIVEQLATGNTNVVVTYLGANGDSSYTPGIASRTNVMDYTTGDANGGFMNSGWQDTGQTNILSGGNGSGTITSMTDTAIPGARRTGITACACCYRNAALQQVILMRSIRYCRVAAIGMSVLFTALAAQAQLVKVMEYDASQEIGANTNPTPQSAAFTRVIAYQQPDIVCFSELNDGSSAATVGAGVINWVTNNLASTFGTKTGVTFWVYIASVGDGFNRNGEISRYPIVSGTTYSDAGGGFADLRGMDSIKIQLSGTNTFQIFHAQLKAGGGTLDTNSNCERKQAEAATDATNMMYWASTNQYPYVWTCDCNEDEDPRDAGYTAPYTTPECPLSSTYHPVTTIEQVGGVVDYTPTTLDGVWRTWSTTQTAGQPSDMFDRILAATNRLAPASGLVFSTFDWAAHGLYTNASPQNLVTDSYTADDHFDVLVTYSFPTSATNFSVSPTSFTVTGNPGGPFTPSSQACVLTNFDTIPLFWSVTNQTGWLSISSPVGNLGAGLGTNITASITAAANSLAAGTYTDTITFSNTATGVSLPVGVTLTVGTPPVANFTASPTNGAAPLSVNFTDRSSGVTGWAWAFGDGNTSSSQNPSDIYVSPGSYTVQLIVTGNGGSATDRVVNAINVYDPFAWWQLQYFGSTNNTANTAPGGDYTGTGMSNTNKFLAGFNPTNAAAYLHVISVVDQLVAGNTNIVVTYLGPNGDNSYRPGITSRTNVLDYMTGDANGGFMNSGWQDTGQTNILSGGNGSGTITSMTDAAIPGAPTNRYYRVRVLLP